MARARAGEVQIALLRGINVGGRRKVPMAELRAVAEGLGFGDVASYVQSGNLVYRTSLAVERAAAALAQAIEAHFGFDVPVIVRAASRWRRHAAGSPFPDAEAARANLLHLCLACAPVPRDAVARLTERATAGERIAVVSGALWIDFAGGVARSKLTPALLDRVAGASVTARNWRTVQALAALAAERG
jgi:uncharacterized protein (DUF1697 family)